MRFALLCLLATWALAACAAPSTAPPIRGEAWIRHVAATPGAFEHVLGFDGELLTKGEGGLYPHHRGVFLGWDRVRVDGATHDFWHLTAGRRQRDAGPDVEWTTGDGHVVVRETRTIRAHGDGDGVRVFDFVITLVAAGARVDLDGTPHHGGFHFRATSELERRQDQTTFLRAGGARAAGDDVWDDCEWAAMCFPLAARRYVVALFTHPADPGPVRFTTRAYGRFGAFFRAALEPGRPLELRFRLVVIDAAVAPHAATPAALADRARVFSATR